MHAASYMCVHTCVGAKFIGTKLTANQNSHQHAVAPSSVSGILSTLTNAQEVQSSPFLYQGGTYLQKVCFWFVLQVPPKDPPRTVTTLWRSYLLQDIFITLEGYIYYGIYISSGLHSCIYFPQKEVPRNKDLITCCSRLILFHSAPQGTYGLSYYTPLEEASVSYTLRSRISRGRTHEF